MAVKPKTYKKWKIIETIPGVSLPRIKYYTKYEYAELNVPKSSVVHNFDHIIFRKYSKDGRKWMRADTEIHNVAKAMRIYTSYDKIYGRLNELVCGARPNGEYAVKERIGNYGAYHYIFADIIPNKNAELLYRECDGECLKIMTGKDKEFTQRVADALAVQYPYASFKVAPFHKK